jgi:hypothetical protein
MGWGKGRSRFDVEDLDPGFPSRIALASVEGEKRATLLMGADDHERVVHINAQLVRLPDGFGKTDVDEAHRDIFRYSRVASSACLREAPLLEAGA